MRKKIVKAPCLLLSLFTSLNLCSAKFGTPITDDVSKLSLLKQNIPSDYEIPVHYIPKEVAGTCWVVLNIYPLEQSLRKLANMFGTISSNKENIIVFIAMLKSLRFTFDHEELETAMQVFQCHYQEGSLMSGLYFDYIRDVLHAATQGNPGFSCKPPPCTNPQQTPGGQKDGREYSWSKRTPLFLTFIPIIACVVLIIWLFKSGKRLPVCSTENSEMAPSDMVPTVSISIPLQTLTHAADAQPAREAIPEHESG
ncbi:kit ligand b [Scomber scombrus]|uniref:kit ligand b n=1 Tax=Scomber scombrus TaxID=13677 RepID=UPI002DDA3209|nr:kit ligand b [Scomber scombrus]